MRVLAFGLQGHQINHVNDPDLQVRKVAAQQVHRRQRFQRRHVARTGHHHVGLGGLSVRAGVAAGPLPDPQPGGAVQRGAGHIQPLRRRLLAGHHDVDILATAQAVIHHRQQGVGVGRQVDPHHIGLLVHHVVDEPGVLVRVAVVVLAPDVRSQQDVERGDVAPPGHLAARLEPLGVLVEHRVDNVDKRLVAREQPVAPAERVAFQPALTQMFAEHFHHPAIWREVLISGQDLLFPGFAGGAVHRVQPVGSRLVRAEQAEGAHIALHHVP